MRAASMLQCARCSRTFDDGTAACPDDGAPLLPDEASDDLAAGTRVGEYTVEAKIGVGGFGAVYRAVHPVIGKGAAIKVLDRRYSSNPEMVSRFVSEARAVNQIKHRNIVDIFSFGVLPGGRHYLVMELLEGKPLDAVLDERGRLPLEEVLPIARGIARALAAAHATGIVHRDLKPENIFVAFDDDGRPSPKLIDFGIAKLLGDAPPQSHKTRTGAPIGTPYYMSPEQCRGRPIDQRTDIYALGIVLHQMLTGQRPFDGFDAVDVYIKHVTQPAAPMSSVCSEVPAALDAPVLAMLAKEAENRPSTALQALAAFEDAVASLGRPSASPSEPHAGGVRGPASFVPASPSGVARALTPHERALSDARTITPDGSLPASESAPREAAVAAAAAPPSRLTVLFVAAAIVVLAGGAGVAASRSGRSAPPGQGGPAVSAAPVVTSTPSASPSAPAHPTDPKVAPAPEVEITIDASPLVVDVFRGESRIGSSASPLRLSRSEERVRLTLKAPGFLSQDLEVLPQGPTTYVTRLSPNPQASPPRRGGAAPVGATKAPAPKGKKAGGDPSEISF